MKTFLDCVPCIIEQAVKAPRRFTDDQDVLEGILRDTIKEIVDFDFFRTPPEMGAILNRIIALAIGNPDPYLSEKRRFNDLALRLLPDLEKMIASANDPFEATLRLAIAGNAIDFGAPSGQTDGNLSQLFSTAVKQEIAIGGRTAVEALRKAASHAKEILYLTDNTGEIVIDRLLIEQLPKGRVTVAVRHGPAINDALLEDAEAVGISKVARVITSGVSLPGTPLDVCPPEFQDRFKSADLIISKGQGNFETLSDEKAPIFFLLMAKCKVVANHLSCRIGDSIVKRGLSN